LTPDGNINPEITPEKGWNFELGSRGKIASKLTYELTLYSMRIRDLLVARRVGEDQFVGLNAGKKILLMARMIFLEMTLLVRLHM